MKYDVYQGLFIWPQKKTLNLHLTYFVETLYSASPQTNKKALIPLGIRAFPNFAFAVRTGLEPVTPCVTGMYSNQLN